jgi:hypothetical protein
VWSAQIKQATHRFVGTRGEGGLLTTASDELVGKPILGGWLRVRSAPFCQTRAVARARGVNNPAIQRAPPTELRGGGTRKPQGLLDGHERERARGFQALARRAKAVGGGL